MDISLGPSQSQIINEGTPGSVRNFFPVKKNSLSGSIETDTCFRDISDSPSGIGFSSYKTQLTLDSYQNNLNTRIQRMNLMNEGFPASDIKEIQKVGSLSIPFCFNFHIPFTETIWVIFTDRIKHRSSFKQRVLRAAEYSHIKDIILPIMFYLRIFLLMVFQPTKQ